MFDAVFSPDQMRLVEGMVYAILALVAPKAALFVILPVTALASTWQLGDVVLRPDDLLLSILAVSWGLRRLMATRQVTPIDRPLLGYVAIGVAATLWGAAIGTADLFALRHLSASGLLLLKRAEFVIYYFIITDTLKSAQDVRRFIYVFMASLAGLSLFSLSRFYATGYIALGPIGTPIHEPGLASMLNVGLSLGLLVAARNTATTVLASVILLGSLWILPLTLGRNYLASTIVMLGLVAFSRKRSILLLIPVAGMIAWAMDVVFPTVPLFPHHVVQRVMTLLSAITFSPSAHVQGVSLADRFGPAFIHSWEVITSSPLFGWGLGSVSVGAIDNEYAGQIVYTGLLGFAVFLTLVVRIARMAHQAYLAAKAQDSPALPLIAGLQHCLLGYALYSTFSPSISAARAGAFFFTIIGCVAVLHRALAPAAESESSTAVTLREEPYPDRLGQPVPKWVV
jgi:hypothetical protein